MNLHDCIMNIKFPHPDIKQTASEILAAKTGHRDAKHSAAELALKADAVINAARLVLSFRRNEPYRGDLIDNNKSRDALQSLSNAISEIDS